MSENETRVNLCEVFGLSEEQIDKADNYIRSSISMDNSIPNLIEKIVITSDDKMRNFMLFRVGQLEMLDDISEDIAGIFEAACISFRLFESLKFI